MQMLAIAGHKKKFRSSSDPRFMAFLEGLLIVDFR